MIISKSHCRAGRRPLVHSISVRLSDKVIFVVWNTDLKSLSYFQRNETRLTSNERSNPDNNKKKTTLTYSLYVKPENTIVTENESIPDANLNKKI